jgi:hypothetical protein
MVEKKDGGAGALKGPPPDYEIAALKRAQGAFFSEDFAEAEQIFTDILANSDKGVYKNEALYGVACTRMMVAEDVERYKAAIRLLETWRLQGVGINEFGENPRMIIQALARSVTFLECEPEIKYVINKKNDELVKKQQDEIQKLYDTIGRLQHQISVLEAIDQETQEKRKPL